MIESLDHSTKNVAKQIYELFQLSYRVEASLLDVEKFPPLRRSVANIRSSSSQFLGLRIEVSLAAVIEYTDAGADLSIDSLVVHPQYFRRGLAGDLLQSLLARDQWQNAFVETATANSPALHLYLKFGFSELKRWSTADGIDKVQLMRTSSE